MPSFSTQMLLPLSVIALAVEAVTPAKVLSVPFQSRNTTSSLSKRMTPLPVDLDNHLPYMEYFVTVTVGSPPQTVELIIDTGSSDTWVFSPGVCNTKASEFRVCDGGVFDSNKSSTYHLVEKDGFKIEYVDGTHVDGDYITECVGIGGITLSNLQIAAATSGSQLTSGIMGIGLENGEANVNWWDDESTLQQYPNLPASLFNQGIINTKSYSFYLDDLASAHGQVLFGGYDRNKFTGDLTMLPLQHTEYPDKINRLAVSWTSLSITTEDDTVLQELIDLPVTVVLDTGSPATVVPAKLYNYIVNSLPFEVGKRNVVLCSMRNTPGQINFGFGGPDGPVIAVPFAELIVPLFFSNGTLADSEVCMFGIVSVTTLENAPKDYLIFGQSFLRSAYVMYDLTNQLVGLAPTVFDSTTSDIVDYSNASSADVRIVTETFGTTVSSLTSIETTTSGLRSYPSHPMPTIEPASLEPIDPASAGTQFVMAAPKYTSTTTFTGTTVTLRVPDATSTIRVPGTTITVEVPGTTATFDVPGATHTTIPESIILPFPTPCLDQPGVDLSCDHLVCLDPNCTSIDCFDKSSAFAVQIPGVASATAWLSIGTVALVMMGGLLNF